MVVGAAGSGSFQQTGGTFIKTGAMTIARDSGSNGTYTLSGGTLTDPAIVVGKNGSGAFVQNTASGPSTLIATSLTISGGTGTGSYNYQAGVLNVSNIQINTGGVFTHAAAGAVSANALALSGTGQYIMTAGNNKALVLNSLSITGASTLDVNDNAVIVNYGSDTTHSARDAIRNLLKNGRNAGAAQAAPWNGAGGIVSTYANQNGNGFNLAVGYADNTDLAAVRASGSYTTFGGQTVASNTVLVQLTRGADATLDGVVDGQDVAIIGTHFQKPGSGQWCFGDFDYSGTCDGSDVAVLGTTFGKTSPILSPAQMTAEFGEAFTAAFEAGQSGAVPEPGGWALLGLGGVAGMASRRRKRRGGGEDDKRLC